MEWIEYTAGTNDDGRRIDILVKRIQQDAGLSGLFAAIRKGLIRVNGNKVTPSERVYSGDKIGIAAFLIQQPEAGKRGSSPALSSADIPVLYENKHIIVFSKPAGMLVHDGPESLAARVKPYLLEQAEPSLSFRPGPLHRLDRNTSGAIVFSKSLAGAQWFSEAMKNGGIRKIYLAVLQGSIQKTGIMTWTDRVQRSEMKSYIANSGGDLAVTHCLKIGSAEGYSPESRSSSYSLTALEIETGRTHQIRIQTSERGWPVYGDRKYGSTEGSAHSMFLHAAVVSLPAWEHSDRVLISAPLPRRWYEQFRLDCISAAPRDTEGRKQWYAQVIKNIQLQLSVP
ncbi:pseudouridine synthase [Spirochaeta dissipatitropha]